MVFGYHPTPGDCDRLYAPPARPFHDAACCRPKTLEQGTRGKGQNVGKSLSAASSDNVAATSLLECFSRRAWLPAWNIDDPL